VYSGSLYSATSHQSLSGAQLEQTLPLESVRGHTGRLLGAALGYLLALGLTCLVFVWTSTGQRLDAGLLPRAERGGGYEQQTVLIEPAKTVLSYFGDPTVLAILLGAVLVVGALGRRLWAAVAGVGVVLCSVCAASVIKLVTLRPDLRVEGSTTHNSFPSGHVAAAMGLLLAFMLVLPSRARWWLAVPGAAGVSVVASATMIAGWHRFSDALGGVLLATVLFCLAATALTARHGGPPAPRGEPSTAGTGPGGWSAAAIGGLILLVGLPLMFVSATATPTGEGLCFVIVAVSGFTGLAVVSVLCLVHPIDFVVRTWWPKQDRRWR
jgi:membrane-associated phospholipid phosphatase